MYSLCKYGDVYLRLYRESDYNDTLFGIKDKEDEDENKRQFINEEIINSVKERLDKDLTKTEEEKEKLLEDVKIIVHKNSDKYAHYIEMVPNPAEMFELLRLGKTYAYIQAPVNLTAIKNENNMMYTTSFRYSFKKQDVNLYQATEYVHASLEDNMSRAPEEIDIVTNDDETSTSTTSTFKVKRGQSILYNVFKSWRNLSLLENSMMLNRLTKSSIVRIINVQVGDMPKDQIPKHLMGIKQLIEQKTAINEGTSIQEYTNPGPMENNVYVPVHGEVGTLSMQEVGGDVDVKGIADVEYFKNRMYSSLKIPKQFLGDTEDNTGFNGGTSLTLISSRYAKTIKRIQNTMIQALTDAVNLLLLDKGLESYINKFELHMMTPSTVEEADRRENLDRYVGIISNIMSLLDGVEDASQRLKILKSLLANILTDEEVLDILQEEIDKLEDQEEAGIDTTKTDDEFQPDMGGFHTPSGAGPDNMDFGDEFSDNELSDTGTEEGGEEDQEVADMLSELPTPDSLGVDMTTMETEV